MHANGKQPHILCINHSSDVLTLQKAILEEEGFRATIHSHLEKDLDAIVALAPDAIVLDYMWRQSDDGWVFLNLLTMDRRTREMPIVLCTGAVREARDMQDHLTSLGIRVVLKPFHLEHLINAVDEALGKGEHNTQSERSDSPTGIGTPDPDEEPLL